MKNIKKFVAVASLVAIIGVSTIAYAATATTPAEIVSSLTGKSVEDIYKEKTSDKTFGTIAKEAGKLDEFKTQMLEQKKAILDQKVKDGTLTQEKANEIYNAIKDNQANCDGTGSGQIGKKYGVGFGKGQGKGQGQGAGQGQGTCNSQCLAN
jgi:hypothetical protein